MTDHADDQRRTEHRPTTLDDLRAEALRLQSQGYRVRDLAQIFGMNDEAIERLIAGDAL